ncbi:MAG: PIN domain-containing protein [Prolixibacteraceae bacterium]|nr:PIN domain-containing protein [Prolixibacteraceae bacterium]
MNYLLDTHTIIWFLNGDEKLSRKSLDIIENQDSLKFLSVATIWEIAIKISLDNLYQFRIERKMFRYKFFNRKFLFRHIFEFVIKGFLHGVF